MRIKKPWTVLRVVIFFMRIENPWTFYAHKNNGFVMRIKKRGFYVVVFYAHTKPQHHNIRASVLWFFMRIARQIQVGSKQIRAPFDGFIKSITVSNGDYVAQGVALVSVGTHQSKVLKTQLAPDYGLTMDNAQGIWYQDNDGQWKDVTDAEGKILSIGKDVERENPLISVFAQVNAEVEMPEGSLTPVQIAMGNATQNTMIPVNALLEDYGSYSVIVQLSGESFERRPVKIGKRNGENVEILEGLQVGEVVVTTGAYQVKMASMSGSTPAHGHEH